MNAIDTIAVGGSLEPADGVPLDKVETELAARLQIAQLDAREPVRRVRMSNLIIVCSQTDVACAAEEQVPEIVGFHPARVTLLVTEPEATHGVLRASVLVRKVRADPRLVSEQVTLHAGGAMVDQLPFAVRSLLIGDMPTNLWWACTTPPPFAGKLLADLAGNAQQLIYDSRGWTEPNHAIAAAADWLDGFERDAAHGRWRIASDINWRRLKTWRRILTQGLDPASAPGLLDRITEIQIDHGPHAVTQAWQIAGWLASRLGWHYQSSNLEDNVEIAFQFRAPHGWVTLRIDRLATGPAAIQLIRVKATGGDQLDFAIEDNRLSVTHVGRDEAPRTVTLPSQRLGELIGRQLSDREPDPVFRETMRVAQQLARHAVGDSDERDR